MLTLKSRGKAPNIPKPSFINPQPRETPCWRSTTGANAQNPGDVVLTLKSRGEASNTVKFRGDITISQKTVSTGRQKIRNTPQCREGGFA